MLYVLKILAYMHVYTHLLFFFSNCLSSFINQNSSEDKLFLSDYHETCLSLICSFYSSKTKHPRMRVLISQLAASTSEFIKEDNLFGKSAIFSQVECFENPSMIKAVS